MRMKFSYDLEAKHVHHIDDLLKADKEAKLDEYKANTEIGDLKSQMNVIKTKNGVLKFPFLYFYLDKTAYPNINLKSTFVVNKQKDLKLSKNKLYIKMYGLPGFIRRKIKILSLKYIPFARRIHNYFLSKSFNN